MKFNTKHHQQLVCLVLFELKTSEKKNHSKSQHKISLLLLLLAKQPLHQQQIIKTEKQMQFLTIFKGCFVRFILKKEKLIKIILK